MYRHKIKYIYRISHILDLIKVSVAAVLDPVEFPGRCDHALRIAACNGDADTLPEPGTFPRIACFDGHPAAQILEEVLGAITQYS